jgi:hypothetical protein
MTPQAVLGDWRVSEKPIFRGCSVWLVQPEPALMRAEVSKKFPSARSDLVSGAGPTIGSCRSGCIGA